MADYALIKNGKVENVIVADQTFIDGWLPTSGYELAIERIGAKGNIGQEYINGNFIDKTAEAFQGDGIVKDFDLMNTPTEVIEVSIDGNTIAEGYSVNDKVLSFINAPNGEIVIKYKFIV